MESTFRLDPPHEQYQQLTLHGSFPPHWPGSLATGLSTSHISIHSARASKRRFEWDAKFQLDLTQYQGTTDDIDFIELARTEPHDLPDEPVQLTAFTLLRLPTGELEVTVAGPDQIGFLARLLRKMTVLSLFPREFEIDTIGGEVQDRFVLSGIGNLRPTDANLEVLEASLKLMVVK